MALGTNQSNTRYIYQYFQFEADKISDCSCLIYPFGGWFDSPSSLEKLGNKILSDGHTVFVYAYEGSSDKRARFRNDKTPEPLFGAGVNLSAGVSIVMRNNRKNEIFKYKNRMYSDKSVDIDIKDIEYLSPNPLFISINKKIGKNTNKLEEQIKKGIFGIESDYVEKNPDKVSFNINDWQDPILLLTNDKSGSSGRAKEFWTDRSYITKGNAYLDYFKVVIISAYPKQKLISGKNSIENIKKRIFELVTLLPKNSAFGRSRMALFMSRDEEECKNFMKYMQTDFFAGLVLQEPNRSTSFGSIIPSQDYSKDSDINWSLSVSEINKYLYKKYNLTDEEINFIEARVEETK